MDNCVFCKIIKGEIPAEKIYEDENCLAFLDINPVTDGHSLLIPKKHYSAFAEAPDETLAHMSAMVKKIIPKLKTATGADYIALSVVGNDVPHLHIHVIPRRHNDGLANFWPTKKYPEGEIEKVAEEIRKTF